MKTKFKTTVLFLILGTQLHYAQNDSLKARMVLSDFTSEVPHVRDFTMTFNEKEIYFTVMSRDKNLMDIVVMKKNSAGKWEKPEITDFSSGYKDLEPALSPDGKKLFFVSNRPRHINDTVHTDFDIYFVERISVGSQWSNPINMGSPVNTTHDEFYPSVARNGNLYFTAERENSLGKEDIYKSVYINDTYQTPVPLGSMINSGRYEFNAYIASDESFIIFTSYGREDDLGNGDLYLSTRSPSTGTWTAAQHLPEPVNSTALDYCPFINENNGELYFTSNRSKKLKLKDKNLSFDEFILYVNTLPDGSDRLYKVDLDFLK